MTLEEGVRIDTGLKLGRVGIPDLKTGLNFANFSFDGNLPSLKLLLMIAVSGAAKKLCN